MNSAKAECLITCYLSMGNLNFLNSFDAFEHSNFSVINKVIISISDSC